MGVVLRNAAKQPSDPDMRFLGVLGVCAIIAQGSLQPEGPESRILVLPPQAAPFLPSACNSGLTFCELDHLPSAASYPTSHVRKLTHKLKRLRGSILLQPVVNNVTDSTITDFLKRLEPRPQGPSGVVGHSDSSVAYGQDFQGYGTRGQQGPRPNTVSTTGVPGRGRPSKPTHSSMEVNNGNSGDDLEVPLCSAHTRYVRPRAALNSNLEWRWKLFLVLNMNLLSKVHHQPW